jgi:heme A synthase
LSSYSLELFWVRRPNNDQLYKMFILVVIIYCMNTVFGWKYIFLYL